MSLETIGVNGQVYKRAFDHDQARALREADPKRWTYEALALHFGVSVTAMGKAMNPVTRKKCEARTLNWIRENRHEPCKSGCGTLVWTHTAGRSGYCPACIAALRVADAIRDDELLCRSCDEWKPDDEFGGKGPKARRGRRSHCRACESKARAALRHRSAA